MVVGGWWLRISAGTTAVVDADAHKHDEGDQANDADQDEDDVV